MLPSSRTPEGEPNFCPICGHELRIEPSTFPTRDAPCPRCGCLLDFDAAIDDLVLEPGNPTDTWGGAPLHQLVLDLDRHRLRDVGIGDAIDRLSFLGQGIGNVTDLWFGGSGVGVGCYKDRVAELRVFFGHADEPMGGCFTGNIQFDWNTIGPLRRSDEHDAVRLFGPPYWRSADTRETVLFYEHGAREWNLEYGFDGKLKCLVLCEPILADARTRAWYGVTESWPPDPPQPRPLKVR